MTAATGVAGYRDRAGTILALGLPIVGGMASQNVLNLVDTAMVGVLGATSLAAVGIGSFVNFMAIALVMGMSSSVQAMAARRKGEGREGEMAVPLNGGLLLALAMGLPILIVLFVFGPALLPYINGDPGVIAESVPYFQARLCAVFAVGMNFAFRGYWNGVSMSRIYLQVLLIMHATNVVLNYVLIFGALGIPALGTLGAGIGSTLATYVGTAVYVFVGFKHARRAGFLSAIPGAATMLTMVRLALPSALQQFMFAAGITSLFWIIGLVGTAEVAASNVLVNLLLVAFLPGLGLGLAAASLVGQALGRGEAAEARRWGWDVVKLAALVMATIGLPALIVPEILLAGFIHDPEVVAIAREPLRLLGAGMAVDAVGLVLMNALLGAGAARQVMVVTVSLQWLVGLPLTWLVGPYLGFGLLGIWGVQFGYRALQAAVLSHLWRRGRWAAIRV